MTQQWELTEVERELLIDLLESEQHELPSEIRHTDSQRMREELRDRLSMVDELIHRLRYAAAMV